MNDQPSSRWDSLLVIVVAVLGVAFILVVFAVGLASRKDESSASVTDKTGQTVDVKLTEFSVGVPATSFSPGVKTLHVTNAGKVQHELLVFRSDLAPRAYPLDHGDINEDGPGIVKISDGDNIDPGKSQTRTVDLSTPGTYLFVCNLPGHFAQGMYKTVTVGATPESMAVTLSEFKIGVPQTTLPAGTATLSITNKGSTQHELLVFRTDLAPGAFPLDADGSVQEDAPGMNKVSDGDNIDPGKGQTRSVDLSRPGTYVLVCNLPGHFRSGMYTTLTVR